MKIMTELNDGDLRLRDFKVLSVLLRERSLTRAAEALDTTQPSISKVLARLRIHFDDPLFIRAVVAMLVASRTDGVATIPANLATSFAEQLGLTALRLRSRCRGSKSHNSGTKSTSA